MYSSLKVAEAHLHCGEEAEVLYCFGLQGYGIIVEFVIEEDTGHSVSLEHYAVCILGIGAALLHVDVSLEVFIVRRGNALNGKHLVPPLVYLGYL